MVITTIHFIRLIHLLRRPHQIEMLFPFPLLLIASLRLLTQVPQVSHRLGLHSHTAHPPIPPTPGPTVDTAMTILSQTPTQTPT